MQVNLLTPICLAFSYTYCIITIMARVLIWLKLEHVLVYILDFLQVTKR